MPGPHGQHAAVVVALGSPTDRERVTIHAHLCWEIIASVNLRDMVCVQLKHVQVNGSSSSFNSPQ